VDGNGLAQGGWAPAEVAWAGNGQLNLQGNSAGKSTALAAAFQAGLPILGCKGKLTDPNYFHHRENVYLIDTCSEETAHRAIKELINDDALRQILRENAKKTFMQKFSWDIIANLYCKGLKIDR